MSLEVVSGDFAVFHPRLFMKSLKHTLSFLALVGVLFSGQGVALADSHLISSDLSGESTFTYSFLLSPEEMCKRAVEINLRETCAIRGGNSISNENAVVSQAVVLSGNTMFSAGSGTIFCRVSARAICND